MDKGSEGKREERPGECMEGREGAQSCWGDADWGNGHPGNCIDLPTWGCRCCPTAIPWPCTLEAPRQPLCPQEVSESCVCPPPLPHPWMRSPGSGHLPRIRGGDSNLMSNFEEVFVSSFRDSVCILLLVFQSGLEQSRMLRGALSAELTPY